jgi:hypothetical protein
MYLPFEASSAVRAAGSFGESDWIVASVQCAVMLAPRGA